MTDQTNQVIGRAKMQAVYWCTKKTGYRVLQNGNKGLRAQGYRAPNLTIILLMFWKTIFSKIDTHKCHIFSSKGVKVQ